MIDEDSSNVHQVSNMFQLEVGYVIYGLKDCSDITWGKTLSRPLFNSPYLAYQGTVTLHAWCLVKNDNSINVNQMSNMI